MILKKIIQDRWLQAILFIAAVMRFYNYSGWSLSNDELSALVRLQADGIFDLMANGVRPDYHPAGVEVFLYYWVKIFGDSEASIRLPFVIAGIFSVLFVYLIAEKWFGKTTARLSALSISFLQYTILYSQLARPYSPGLLFSLVMVYYWSELIIENKKGIKKNFYWGYIISTVICMYTHYFSFLFAVIVGTTGLVLLKKENIKPYLLSNLTAVIFFIPHISITVEQLSRGGLSSWLGKPEEDFFSKYLSYAFNDSNYLQWTFIFIFICSFGFYFTSIKFIKLQFACLAWFAVPFIIGYYYSIHINPVLQYSVLIFSFPFFLVFIFSFFRENFTLANSAAILLLAIAGISSTTIEKDFYSTRFFGVFKELTEKTNEWNQKYGEKNISRNINVITPFYVDYYFKKSDKRTDYNFIKPGENRFVNNFKTQIENCNKKYFLYAWSNNLNPYEAVELIKRKYPQIVEQQKYFNAEIMLFAADSNYKREVVFETVNNFENKFAGWSCDSLNIDSSESHSGKFSFRVDSSDEYACKYETTIGELFPGSVIFTNLSAWCKFKSGNNVHLVIEFSYKNEVYEWRSAMAENFEAKTNEWIEIFLTEFKPKNSSPTDRVKIYFWNPDKSVFFTDDISVKTFADSQ